jgi:hypothetical protein
MAARPRLLCRRAVGPLKVAFSSLPVADHRSSEHPPAHGDKGTRVRIDRWWSPVIGAGSEHQWVLRGSGKLRCCPKCSNASHLLVPSKLGRGSAKSPCGPVLDAPAPPTEAQIIRSDTPAL